VYEDLIERKETGAESVQYPFVPPWETVLAAHNSGKHRFAKELIAVFFI
jgi:hypothetical protein